MSGNIEVTQRDSVTQNPTLQQSTSGAAWVAPVVAGAVVSASNPLPISASGNVDAAALVTLSAATSGGNSADQVNGNGRGVKLVIDVTAITGTTPSLTVTIQGKDAASGKYYTLLASAAITAVSTVVLDLYPGLTAAANAAANTTLPRTWRVLYAIAGTTPAVSATVGASVIV